MRILGVDPGRRGALALLDGPVAKVRDMPLLGDDYDAIAIRDLLLEWRPTHAMIERTRAHPGMSRHAMHELGYGSGLLYGIILTAGVAVSRAAPSTWKRAMQVPANKNEARRIATEMFPALARYLHLVAHDGRAEALLLAEYGRRRLGGAI